MRKVCHGVSDGLARLDAEFEALHTDFGRPSIPRERLIRASLLQILFSIRSEWQLREQTDGGLMCRRFVGLGIDHPVWGEGRLEICPVDRFQPCTRDAPGRRPAVFNLNRDRLLTTDMSRKVMAATLAHREVAPLLSDDHFWVDGTLGQINLLARLLSNFGDRCDDLEGACRRHLAKGGVTLTPSANPGAG